MSIKLLAAGALASAALAAAPSAAHADATCTSLLSSKFSNLETNAGGYEYTITVARDSLDYVTWAKGLVQLSNGYMTNTIGGGHDAMEFSDRFSGTQNFDHNQTESTEIWITSTGYLYFYDIPYNYYVVNHDMSCSGGLITSYVAGLGTVTIRLGTYVPVPG